MSCRGAQRLPAHKFLLSSLLASVLSQKFIEQVFALFCVITGESRYPERAYAIRPYKNSWIPGRATPDSDPGLPEMTFELHCELRCQDTSGGSA